MEDFIWDPTSWLIDGGLLTVSSLGRRVRELLKVSSTRTQIPLEALVPFMKIQSSWPNHVPQTLPPNTIMLGIRIYHMNLQGQLPQNIYSKASFVHFFSSLHLPWWIIAFLVTNMREKNSKCHLSSNQKWLHIIRAMLDPSWNEGDYY